MDLRRDAHPVAAVDASSADRGYRADHDLPGAAVAVGHRLVVAWAVDGFHLDAVAAAVAEPVVLAQALHLAS